jgi:signal transduction histidine kinase/ActR/RegA family two-component response regulator
MKTTILRLAKKISIRNHRPLLISSAILVGGLVVTFAVSNYVRREEESHSNEEFKLVCKEIKSKIITRINIQTEFLISGSSLFEASQSVTREEWKRFNKFSIGNVKFMGVQGFGFSTIINKEDLKKHISAIQKEGFPKYTVFPEGERTIYTSVIYLEPFGGRNARAFGYDMFSNPVRRKAMELARDNNAPALSGKLFLLLKPKTDIQAGTIIYVPVYKNVPINTIAERRAAITGWVFCAFRMNDLMNSIFGASYLNDKKNLRLQIYEEDTISKKALLFDSQENKIQNNNDSKVRRHALSIVLNNKRWTLVFSQSSENASFYSAQTLLILIGGTIISLLLFALSYSLLITKKRAKIIAERLSLDLLVKNQEYEKMNKSLNKNYKKLISSNEKLDITNEELKKAKIKAEESDKLKSAFLANMSHEIRTPMNGILGFTELLKAGNISPEEQKNYVEIIEKSGIRLLSIINDIVDISKIEAGQMKVSHSTTNVEEQMQYLYTFFKPEAQDKGIQLILKSSLAVNKTIINTDREKLYAILINLVKNAIKYTVKGTIEFGYDIKGNTIEFYVKDTGIGISKDRQKAIFERFIQADFNDKMARQGTGLGLSIAKAYVELLDGKIWVESEPEKGSTFYFTLPYTAHLEEIDTPQNHINLNQPPCEIKNLKILVTEDDNISRMLILKVLEEFGNKILTAQTGLEAVEICRKNPDLDLILMDIQMPLMNGYEATLEIRKFNSEVIILAQTAFALEGDKAKTIAVGCNGYISKPIKKEELSNLLQHFFCKQENLN